MPVIAVMSAIYVGPNVKGSAPQHDHFRTNALRRAAGSHNSTKNRKLGIDIHLDARRMWSVPRELLGELAGRIA